MDSNFTLDLKNTTDAVVISESTTLISKLGGSSYYSALVTTGLSGAVAILVTAVSNKGTGTQSTETALQKRTNVDYQLNLLVGVIDGLINNPAVPQPTKVLMREATGLVLSGTGGRSGPHPFRYVQISAETPGFLEAAGIEGGGGVHAWKITTDVITFTNYELLDPTETAKIELVTTLPEKDYAGSHRFLKSGIWSAWSTPMLFRTK